MVHEIAGSVRHAQHQAPLARRPDGRDQLAAQPGTDHRLHERLLRRHPPRAHRLSAVLPDAGRRRRRRSQQRQFRPGAQRPQRPINNQHDRAAVLSGLETVDFITIFDEPSVLGLVKKVKPDVIVKGGDWGNKEGVVGWDFVESYGGKVMLAPLVQGKSSTATIEKMKALQADTKEKEIERNARSRMTMSVSAPFELDFEHSCFRISDFDSQRWIARLSRKQLRPTSGWWRRSRHPPPIRLSRSPRRSCSRSGPAARCTCAAMAARPPMPSTSPASSWDVFGRSAGPCRRWRCPRTPPS